MKRINESKYMIKNEKTKEKMTPVLKWAGGKGQLLDIITERMPKTYDRYFEPFIGGSAVLLAVAPKKAYINDINEQLINLYNQIKKSPKKISEYLNKLDSKPCDKELYYEIREKFNKKIENKELDIECAALMIWINKHCFNGLYRVNGKGLFNVPYNNKVSGKSIDDENILAIGSYFKKSDIEISCKDFEDFCKDVRKNDFVYFDSPYLPESETAKFTDYTKDGFSMEDHERLAKLYKRLDKIGAKVMLSNNDVKMVYKLYKGYNIKSINVKRMINSNASKRNGKEVLITNY